MTDARFGDFVKEKRLALRMSIKELAEHVGRTDSTVRSWEHGESRPRSDDVFEALSRALRVDEDQLRELAGVEPRQVPEPAPAPPEDPAEIGLRRIPTYRDDPREMMVYWVRGLLTAAGLILLFVVLVWAVDGLFDQLGGLFG